MKDERAPTACTRHDDGERADARLALHGDTPRLEVAYSTNKLVSPLEMAWRFDEAEPLYLQSLEIREALLKPDQPSVTRIRNNLWTRRSSGPGGTSRPWSRQGNPRRS